MIIKDSVDTVFTVITALDIPTTLTADNQQMIRNALIIEASDTAGAIVTLQQSYEISGSGGITISDKSITNGEKVEELNGLASSYTDKAGQVDVEAAADAGGSGSGGSGNGGGGPDDDGYNDANDDGD